MTVVLKYHCCHPTSFILFISKTNLRIFATRVYPVRFQISYILPRSLILYFEEISLITSPAMINPATDGTNAVLPGIVRF